MMHKAWCNVEEVPYNFSEVINKISMSHGWKIDYLNPIWVSLLGRSQLSNPSDLPCFRLNFVSGALMFSLIYAFNKRLSKHSRGWWFETPSRSLWRHRNGIVSRGPDFGQCSSHAVAVPYQTQVTASHCIFRTCRFHLRMHNLQMRCRDLTTRQGTRTLLIPPRSLTSFRKILHINIPIYDLTFCCLFRLTMMHMLILKVNGFIRPWYCI